MGEMTKTGEMPGRHRHRNAVLLAFLVTLIWSSSWIMIKFGLTSLPPVGFAGLRYGLATLCLLPFVMRRKNLAAVRRLSRREWFWLIALGVLYYTVAQGGQYVALAHLPAITVSLVLSLTAVVVVFLGIILLAEFPNRLQWVGVGIFCLGLVFYFYPVSLANSDWVGLAFALAACLSTSLGSILGRQVNRIKTLSPVLVTVISMSIGSILMLIWGGIGEGVPAIGWREWILVSWMAVVNTAFAFTLWNYTLQTLSAMESSIINNTMLVQISILAWLFLGEKIDLKSGIGLALVSAGVILVQLKNRRDDDRKRQVPDQS
jgi:drug/metabolite transporter (DMT)-like permease